jgi:hypothetical protein
VIEIARFGPENRWEEQVAAPPVIRLFPLARPPVIVTSSAYYFAVLLL